MQGQDLWKIVARDDTEMLIDMPENANLRTKWRIRCGKALYALRGSIQRYLIGRVWDIESPKEVWDAVRKLFNRNNMAQLQMLVNELAKISSIHFDG